MVGEVKTPMGKTQTKSPKLGTHLSPYFLGLGAMGGLSGEKRIMVVGKEIVELQPVIIQEITINGDTIIIDTAHYTLAIEGVISVTDAGEILVIECESR